MTPYENLYYAIGELAYAIAKADGVVQKEERQKFHDIVANAVGPVKRGLNISSIIFTIMDRDKASLPDSFQWAVKEIKSNSHYLSPEMKSRFINVMEAVAAAYPPVTSAESDLIERFRKEIMPLQGDPALC